MRELPPDQNPVDAEWTAQMWLKKFMVEELATVISAALKPPEGDGHGAAFNYIKALAKSDVESLLDHAHLGGLVSRAE